MEVDEGNGSGKVILDKDQSHCESSVEIAKDIQKILSMMGSMSNTMVDLITRVQGITAEWQNFTYYPTSEIEENSQERSSDSELPSFPETFDPAGFRDWVDQVEKYFEDHRVLGNEKVPLVAGTLKGVDSSWWEKVVKLNKEVDKRDDYITWDDMKKLLMAKFVRLPTN